jgi:hypothetical protein
LGIADGVTVESESHRHDVSYERQDPFRLFYRKVNRKPIIHGQIDATPRFGICAKQRNAPTMDDDLMVLEGANEIDRRRASFQGAQVVHTKH